MALMKLRSDFFLKIFLNILECSWWSLHSSFFYMLMGKLHQICTVSRLQHPILKSNETLHISLECVNATILVYELLNCPHF